MLQGDLGSQQSDDPLFLGQEMSDFMVYLAISWLVRWQRLNVLGIPWERQRLSSVSNDR